MMILGACNESGSNMRYDHLLAVRHWIRMWAPHQHDYVVEKKAIEDAWIDCIAIVVSHFECSPSDVVKVTIICDICTALCLQVRVAVNGCECYVFCRLSHFTLALTLCLVRLAVQNDEARAHCRNHASASAET